MCTEDTFGPFPGQSSFTSRTGSSPGQTGVEAPSVRVMSIIALPPPAPEAPAYAPRPSRRGAPPAPCAARAKASPDRPVPAARCGDLARESLIPYLHRDIQNLSKGGDEPIGLMGLSSQLSSERNRHADDDQLRTLFLHEHHQLLQSSCSRRILDIDQGPHDRAGGVTDSRACVYTPVIKSHDAFP